MPGNGTAGWRYLLTLAGDEHVKPDRMVHRFVLRLCRPEDSRLTPERAARLLEASADAQAVTRRALGHTVWRFESARARGNAGMCRNGREQGPARDGVPVRLRRGRRPKGVVPAQPRRAARGPDRAFPHGARSPGARPPRAAAYGRPTGEGAAHARRPRAPGPRPAGPRASASPSSAPSVRRAREPDPAQLHGVDPRTLTGRQFPAALGGPAHRARQAGRGSAEERPGWRPCGAPRSPVVRRGPRPAVRSERAGTSARRTAACCRARSGSSLWPTHGSALRSVGSARRFQARSSSSACCR